MKSTTLLTLSLLVSLLTAGSNAHCATANELETGNWMLGKSVKASTSSRLSRTNSLVQLMDSVVNWYWPTNQWIPAGRTINITYDIHDNVLGAVFQTWNGSAWDNSSSCGFTYDANNNLLSSTFPTWNGTNYINSSRTLFTYDAANNRLTETTQIWVSATWSDNNQIFHSYDANNNLIRDSIQLFTFGIRQNLYSYDANNNLMTSIGQSWNGLTWDNADRHTYMYDANNNLLSDTHESWNGTAWYNVERDVNTYDANNNRRDGLHQNWDSGATAWINGDRWDYTYDANNFMTSSVRRQFDVTGTTSIPFDSTHYYFHTAIAGVPEIRDNDALVSVYPNPNSTGYVYIETKRPVSSDIDVTVLNSVGEVVKVAVISTQQKKLDVRDLPSGNYFLLLHSSEVVESHRFMITRND